MTKVSVKTFSRAGRVPIQIFLYKLAEMISRVPDQCIIAEIL